jgi:amino acid transporter
MTTSTGDAGVPARVLSVKDAIMLTIGIVVGAGIFKSPSIVAGTAGSETMLIAAWIAGGLIAMMGALTYAELASSFPSTGGDYHFIHLAYGRRAAFVFAWSRATIVTTGSIAFLAFVFGDYCSQILSLGEFSSAIYGALIVAVLSAIHWASTRASSTAQNWLTSLEILGLVMVAAAGFMAPSAPVPGAGASGGEANYGLMMIMVLLAYSGWNEVAYVSAEMSGDKRGIARALIASIAVVTVLYLLVNLAYLHALGLAGMAKSQAVAADVLKAAFGDWGARMISVIVAVSTLTSINSTLIVGARSTFAAGRDWPALRFLGAWSERGSSPRHALVIQALIAFGLIALGASQRKGFETMVDYTTPVFYLFFLLAGMSLFILRARTPMAERPFRVPLYPVLPLAFCLSCAYLLYSSVNYVKAGALAGLGVLAAGAVIALFLDARGRRH